MNIAHLPSSSSSSRGANPVTSPITSPLQSPHTSEDSPQNCLSTGGFSDMRSNSKRASTLGVKPRFIKKIKVMMYNFGSPRVGNGPFALMFDKEVPMSYRVVVDGDVVTALPPSGYQHIGTEILIDATGSGSIIIDPSFVERWLRTHTKSSVAAHSLLVYRKGLLGIKLSAEFMKQRAVDYAKDDIDADPLRLALKVRGSIHVDSMLDEYDTYAEAFDEEPAAATPRSAADQLLADQLRQSMGLPKRTPTLELRVSPNASLNPEAPASPLSPTSTLISHQIGLTADEAMIIGGNSNSARVGSAEQQEDARHYAHDVETMEDMLSQIQGLKKTGPIKWLKQNTYGRVVKGTRKSRSAKQLDSSVAQQPASGRDVEEGGGEQQFDGDDEGDRPAESIKSSLVESSSKKSGKRAGSKIFAPLKASSDGDSSS